MLWTIIVILVILWLLGFFGRNISSSFPKTGSWIYVLIVIAIILIILNLLGCDQPLAQPARGFAVGDLPVRIHGLQNRTAV